MKTVLLSIHDSSPFFYDELLEVNQSLEGIPKSFLVTPNWHNKCILSKPFIESLKEEEAILHGYSHIGTKKDRMASFLLGGNNFSREFYQLDYQNTLKQIRDGKNLIEELGCKVSGFIPPMWYHNRFTKPVLKELDFKFTESSLSIHNLKSGKKTYNIPMTFDFGKNHRLSRSMIQFWKKSLKVTSPSLIRLAVHPNDVRIGLLPPIKELIGLLADKGYLFSSYNKYLDI